MNQIFINCKFNLRKASSLKPMPIYLVAYISGKQYKVATGVKVLPFQWDKSRQMAIVSNVFNEIDNYNNTIVNEKLTAMREQFSNYLDYLCTHQENATDLFRQTFYKSMAKNESNEISAADAIKIIKRAFITYYRDIEPTVKGDSQYQQKCNLNKFIGYVKTMDKVVIKDLLSQRSMNDFKSYMIQNKVKPKHINVCGGIIVTLINNVFAVHNDYLKYNVIPVQWVKAKVMATKEDNNKNFPLYEDEIQAIKDCEELTDKEKEFRTIFLLHCKTGLRYGDLYLFMNGQYKKLENGYYYIDTEKTGKESMVEDDDQLKEYLAQIKNFKLAIKSKNKKRFLDNYNKSIKSIAKKVKSHHHW